MTEAENEYVIRGNAAIVRCKIPSFVSDFVHVDSWVMDDGEILTINNTNIVDGTYFAVNKNPVTFPFSNPNFQSCQFFKSLLNSGVTAIRS